MRESQIKERVKNLMEGPLFELIEKELQVSQEIQNHQSKMSAMMARVGKLVSKS